MTARALKVLDEGGIGRFSGFRWPLPTTAAPGPWVEAGGEIQSCVRGIHACLPDQLPTWLGAQLYLIELEGSVIAAARKLVAPRGRLLRRVEAWDRACQQAFIEASALAARDLALPILRAEGDLALADHLAACRDLASLEQALSAASPAGERGRLSLGYVSDAIVYGRPSPPGGAYTAAHAGLDEASFFAARAAQARWLSDALDLPALLAG